MNSPLRGVTRPLRPQAAGLGVAGRARPAWSRNPVLDPDQATLFVQSDVPEVTELTWLLTTITPMPMLENCHAYKDKKARGLVADAGLFNYPVLMAADILAYDSTLVPVGQDQKQHIEVTRDLAAKFNHLYTAAWERRSPRSSPRPTRCRWPRSMSATPTPSPATRWVC